MSTTPNRKKSQPNINDDFVSPDVNQALQEAKQVISQQKSKEQPNQNLVEESTTVKLKNFGNKTDPVEVFISRCTKTTQDDGDEGEIIASQSDSELRKLSRSQPRKLSKHHAAYSDDAIDKIADEEDISSKFHTNVRYRKKHDELWTKDSDARNVVDSPRKVLSNLNDEAHLEVDVKEECIQEDGENFVVKTWEARWTVQNFEALPDWLKDNEYLLTGHRPPLPSVVECFKSIWSIHTETGNIWTHLIGCIAFFCLAVWFLTRPDTHIQFQEKLVFSFFFMGAIVCLGLSFAFHTLSCHSNHVLKVFSKLDYTGISLLIVGSFIPWIYYGFYCRKEPKITYIALICVLGVAAIVISMWDKFNESRYRALRAGVFVSMGCSGVIPALHFIYTDGMRKLIDENGFYWLLTMATFYLIGATLYACRIPERFFPGKVDLFLHSHQLFHMCVVVAAFVHYYGISEMAMNKLTSECPVDGVSVSQSRSEL